MKKLIIILFLLLVANCFALEVERQKNVATVIMFPLFDSTTTTALQSNATALDSEFDQFSDSGDNPDGFADCTNEATEVGATGQYYLILTQGEMNDDYITVQIKASDAITQTILIRTTIGDPLNYATTDDGGTINVTGGAVDSVTTTTTNSDMVTEPATALAAIKLDHLMNIAVDTNFQTTVHNDSVIGYMTTSSGTADYVRTTDSLEDLRDRGDAAWITATGFAVANDVTTAHSTTDAKIDTTDGLIGTAQADLDTITGANGVIIGSGSNVNDSAWQELIELLFDFDATATYATANAGSLVKQIADNAASGGATAQQVWEYDVSAISNTDQAGGISIWLFNVMEGDSFIDTTQTPWQAVVNKKGTPATEYLRKNLFDVSSGNITSIATVIGKQTEP